jgi:hypothetical protein
MPLALQRVELISPLDGIPLAYQTLLPTRNRILLGPLGGIQQAVLFAPYDAICREALTSSGLFYRLLSAADIFEGTATIRKWLRAEAEARGKRLIFHLKESEEQLRRSWVGSGVRGGHHDSTGSLSQIKGYAKRDSALPHTARRC